MALKPTEINTSKYDSSRRQINAAIAHLHNKDFECAITLAAAAEGQLPDIDVSLFRRLLKRDKDEKMNLDLNGIITWLKHPTPDKPTNATISEFEVALTISRAIHKFVATYAVSMREFEGFSIWAVENGHLPRQLTEPSE